MANLCIIPARGGSKRIPRKNIRNFLGKPIIAYSILAAINSGLFEEVMVSTDDEEIADIAQGYNVKVPFMRSPNTSSDYATTYQVIDEVLIGYNRLGRAFENVCCLYPCAPFVTGEKLILAYNTLISNDFESVVPVVAYSFPIQRAFKIDGKEISFFYPEYAVARSQDLEKSYHDAGQFYWNRVSALLINRNIFAKKTGSIILSELEVQDIDNETDWKLAEMKYKINEYDKF